MGSSLSAELAHPDHQVRCRALERLAAAEASPLFRADVIRLAISDRNSRVRLMALGALARYWPQVEAVRALASRLADEAHVATEVVRVLAGIGDEQAFAMLDHAFLSRAPVWLRIRIIGQMHLAPQARIHAFLLRSGCLDDHDERIRSAAVAMLARLSNASLSRVFLARVSDPSPRVRANALEALAARFPGNQTTQVLVRHLADDHHRVRSVAVKLLVDRGIESAEEHLQSMVESTSFLFRTAAAWVLREVGASDRRLTWIRQLLSDESEPVASMAERALARHQLGSFSGA